jgi:ribosomal protein L37AE/L43A
VAGDREIWMYADFRVIFENEEVLEVRPTFTGERTKSSPTPPPTTDSPAWLISPPTVKTETVASDEPIPAKPIPVLVQALPAPSSSTARSSAKAAVEDPANRARSIGIGALVFLLALLLAKMTAERRSSFRSKSDRGRERFRTSGHGASSTHGQGGAGAARLREISLNRLRELEWKRLEGFTSEYFAAQGWRSEHRRTDRDGGVDVKLVHRAQPSRRAYLRCKNQRQAVGLKCVRDLYGVMAEDGIDEGYFVTASDFTADARAFASGKALQLLNGADLVSKFGSLPAAERERILAKVFEGDYMTPSCPDCEGKMVRAQRVDGLFWECSAAPQCRATLPTREESISTA